MSKLPQAHRFWDISDYARPGARWLVRVLHPTPIGSITLTWLFTLVGLISITLIYHRKALVFAGILLILKSLIDAADGEMARARNRPSYTGRYLDSINDFILNGLILFAVGIPLMIPIWK
jgi:phosphatidylglycerophosphate synthase